jgi:cell division protein FtsZ
MENAGSALMGIGRGSGENRAVDAAKAAIDSPLLELSIDGAKGILFTVTGGADLGMYEVNEAARVITASIDPNAKVIFGTVIDETLKGEVRITVIATGFGKNSVARPVAKKITPQGLTPMESPRMSDRRNIEPPTRPAPTRPVVKPIEPAQPPQPKKPEEDLEIPAFIRRKMM